MPANDAEGRPEYLVVKKDPRADRRPVPRAGSRSAGRGRWKAPDPAATSTSRRRAVVVVRLIWTAIVPEPATSRIPGAGPGSARPARAPQQRAREREVGHP